MAERVVDVLEPVEVEAEQRKRLAARRTRDGTPERVEHRGAVGEAGQTVAARHLHDLVGLLPQSPRRLPQIDGHRF